MSTSSTSSRPPRPGVPTVSAQRRPAQGCTTAPPRVSHRLSRASACNKLLLRSGAVHDTATDSSSPSAPPRARPRRLLEPALGSPVQVRATSCFYAVDLYTTQPRTRARPRRLLELALGASSNSPSALTRARPRLPRASTCSKLLLRSGAVHDTATDSSSPSVPPRARPRRNCRAMRDNCRAMRGS